MIPKPDIRATDPIFEAMRNWMKTHPGVSMRMQYDNFDNSVIFRMERVATGECITRSVSFLLYDNQTSTSEQVTREELETMYIQLTKGDKDE